MESVNSPALTLNNNNITRLYEASLNGDIDALRHLIEEDQLTLKRITPVFFAENALHIAALHGHFCYAAELLRCHPPLAEEVDAWGQTPLHLASAKGYVDTVRVLVQPDFRSACLRRNSEGRLPLHLAIMKRHVEVVRELVRAQPQAARETLDRTGQNAAHLCVRGNYLEGLRAIVEGLDGDEEFVESRDGDGNTALHLAAALKRFEIVEYILALSVLGQRMASAMNRNGQTALDMAENNIPRDLEDLQVTNFLINKGLLRGKGRAKEELTSSDLHLPISCNNNKQETRRSEAMIAGLLRKGIEKFKHIAQHYDKKWVESMNQSLIIVAVLVATMAFQGVLQPPGGVYPTQTTDTYANMTVYPAGSAVSAGDGEFFTFNTLAFLSSLSVILLLVSGAPLYNRCCVWVLVLFVWGILTFMTLTYSASLLVVDAPPFLNMTEFYREANVTIGIGDYFYFSKQPAAYSSTMLTWFIVLGGVILYHLLVVVVMLPTLLCRLFSRLKRPPPFSTTTT